MSEETHVIIARTPSFSVKVPNLPHVPRSDGGHIFVETNHGKENRWEFSEEEAIEQAWLTQLAGEAFWLFMREDARVPIYKLNFQDNGNWAFVDGKRPVFHVHIYGRSEEEKTQEYGQALSFPWRDTGYYDGFDAMSADDVRGIAKRMEELSKTDRYAWESMEGVDVSFPPLDETR